MFQTKKWSVRVLWMIWFCLIYGLRRVKGVFLVSRGIYSMIGLVFVVSWWLEMLSFFFFLCVLCCVWLLRKHWRNGCEMEFNGIEDQFGLVDFFLRRKNKNNFFYRLLLKCHFHFRLSLFFHIFFIESVLIFLSLCSFFGG